VVVVVVGQLDTIVENLTNLSSPFCTIYNISSGLTTVASSKVSMEPSSGLSDIDLFNVFYGGPAPMKFMEAELTSRLSITALMWWLWVLQ
jgi:hypothetical protein